MGMKSVRKGGRTRKDGQPATAADDEEDEHDGPVTHLGVDDDGDDDDEDVWSRWARAAAVEELVVALQLRRALRGV